MSPSRLALVCLIVCGWLFCLPPFLFAQSGRGTISGTVRDTSGAVVPQVKITVINTATRQRTDLTTNGTGDFTAAEVPVGTYNVEAEKVFVRQSSRT